MGVRNWKLGWFRATGTVSNTSTKRTRTHQLEIDRLEDRVVPVVSIFNNGGNGYSALDFTNSGGFVPPDTNGAAGPSVYVQTVNQAIALYNPKATGASAQITSLDNFYYTVGGLTQIPGSSRFDPTVLYNQHIGRFIVGNQDANFTTTISNFNIAVSRSSHPTTLTTADWAFYSFSTSQPNVNADFPGNIGYNADATVITLNMFPVAAGPVTTQILSISNADLAVAAPAPANFRNNLPTANQRPATIYDNVPGGPMWLVQDNAAGGLLNVTRMTNVLSAAATFTTTPLFIGVHSQPNAPLNPDGSPITQLIDARIQKASMRNNTLVATHQIAAGATQNVAPWYVIDVSGAAPTISQQGQINAGANTYVMYPGIDINFFGDIGMTYMLSGTNTPTNFMSMWVTGRLNTDPAGTMQAPVLVPAGTGLANYNDFSATGRAGDYSGINVDPIDNTFWATSEFANTLPTANWGTAVANFGVRTPLPPPPPGPPPPPPPPPPMPGPPLASLLVVGSAAGSNSLVRVLDANGLVIREFQPYANGFNGGVNVASGDVTGDGVADIITAPASNGGADIRVYDGVTGAMVAAFLAYDAEFDGGASVAVGDLDGDGVGDIITGAGTGGGPHVRVFTGRTFEVIRDFLAYGAGFRGGISVASADFNRNGRWDIVTGAGSDGGAHIRLFTDGNSNNVSEYLVNSPIYRGGVDVAAGDLDGNLVPELIVGASSGGSKVTIFKDGTKQNPQQFDAYPGFRGGVRVAFVDPDSDGVGLLATSPGNDGGANLRLFKLPNTDPILDVIVGGGSGGATV